MIKSRIPMIHIERLERGRSTTSSLAPLSGKGAKGRSSAVSVSGRRDRAGGDWASVVPAVAFFCHIQTPEGFLPRFVTPGLEDSPGGLSDFRGTPKNHRRVFKPAWLWINIPWPPTSL